MSNSYFRFKQFTIEQERCGMKVTTDACIQGAWTPVPQHTHRVLDIGTGSGLLALMMAQRCTAAIDAVELDADACSQASENVAGSPWHNRVQIIQADIRNYVSPAPYDLIISNPPFFINSLTGNDKARNTARHTATLSYQELLAAIDKNLAPGGTASILLPVAESKLWEEIILKDRWHIHHQLNIQHTSRSEIKRVITVICREEGGKACHTLIIKDADGNYTPAFSRLLSPFYLQL